MSDILDTDSLLVSRSNTPYNIQAQNLMAELQDDDLMLVSRGGVSYKATGLDVKGSLSGGGGSFYPEIDEVTSSPAFSSGSGTEIDPFILTTVDARPGGASRVSVETVTFDVAGAVEGNLVVWTDNSVGAGTRFVQATGVVDVNGLWSGPLTYTDTPDTTSDTTYTGDIQIGDIFFRWTVEQGIDPIRPITPVPSEVTASPDFQSGTGTLADPYILSSQTIAPYGATAQSLETITIAEVGAGSSNLVRWTDNSPAASGTRFNQAEGVTDGAGLWSGLLTYDDTPASTADEVYQGNLQIGDVYFSWAIDQRLVASEPPAINSLFLIENNPVSEDRFTSQVFTTTTSIDDGIPTAAKIFDAHVDGALAVTPETDPISSISDSGGTSTLTFTADKDLNVFEVGDEVYGDTYNFLEPLESSAAGTLTFATNTEMATLLAGDVVSQASNFTEPLESSSGTSGSFSGYCTGATAFPNGDGTYTDFINFTANTVTGAEFLVIGDTLTGDNEGNTVVVNSASSINGSGLFTFEFINPVGPTAGSQNYNGTTQTVTDLNFATATDMGSLVVGDTVSQAGGGSAAHLSGLTTTYAGSGASRSIVNGIDLASNGGLVWIKSRNTSNPHILADSETGLDVFLQSNSANVSSMSGRITSFNSDGFSIGSDSDVNANFSSQEYVAWCFQKQSGFFDAIKYTGDGVNNRKINHNLGVAAGFLIIKNLSSGMNWSVWHQILGSDYQLTLNSDAARSAGCWNGISPNTQNFTLDSSNSVNALNDEYVAYVFPEDNNNAKCGLSNAFSEVTTGFEPQWVLLKTYDSTGNWVIADNKRLSGGETQALRPNLADIESGSDLVTFTPTGFINKLANGCLYVAIAAPPAPPSGTVGSILNTTATLSSSSGTWADGVDVTTGDKVSTGTVGSITGTTVTLSAASGTWVDGNDIAGPDHNGQGTVLSTDVAGNSMALNPLTVPFLVGQTVAGIERIVEDTRLYLEFNSSGLVTDLLLEPQDPPYATLDSNPTLTLTFPAILPDGNAPDDVLPTGTTLTTVVVASNSAGSVGPAGDTVQPVSPLPPAPLAGLTTLYTGTDSPRTITNGINLADDGGLVWIKSRTIGLNHVLTDTARGASKSLDSATGAAEFDASFYLTGFNSDGFTMAAGSDVNAGSADFAAWTFGKAEGYFDVVEFTSSNATTFQTIPHSLGTMPGLIITKEIGGEGDWYCYHSAIGDGGYVTLNTTALSSSFDLWRTSDTDFQLNSAALYGNGNEVIAYLFAEDTPGVIKCGSYIGNGSTSGPTITTGFEPQWLLIKKAVPNSGNDFASSWIVLDNKRNTTNPRNSGLFPNQSSAENTTTSNNVTFNSDGFTIDTNTSSINGTSNTLIYVAIAAPGAVVSQTPEEFEAAQVSFETFGLNSAVYQGDQAAALLDAYYAT